MKTSLAGSCDTEVAALFAHLFMESCSIAFAIQAGQGQAYGHKENIIKYSEQQLVNRCSNYCCCGLAPFLSQAIMVSEILGKEFHLQSHSAAQPSSCRAQSAEVFKINLK